MNSVSMQIDLIHSNLATTVELYVIFPRIQRVKYNRLDSPPLGNHFRLLVDAGPHCLYEVLSGLACTALFVSKVSFLCFGSVHYWLSDF